MQRLRIRYNYNILKAYIKLIHVMTHFFHQAKKKKAIFFLLTANKKKIEPRKKNEIGKK